MKKVDRLVKLKASTIDYKRVYLHEVEKNKIRPLGVPTVEWRIYLHMYNNLLVQWRLVYDRGNQHGYLPNKGVVTA